MEERPIDGACESSEARDREFAALPEELKMLTMALQRGPLVVLGAPMSPFDAVPYPHYRFSILSDGVEIESATIDLMLLEMVLKDHGLDGVKLFIVNEVIACLEGVRETWHAQVVSATKGDG